MLQIVITSLLRRKKGNLKVETISLCERYMAINILRVAMPNNALFSNAFLSTALRTLQTLVSKKHETNKTRL